MPRAPRHCPGDRGTCDNLIAGSQRYCDDHDQPWRGPRTTSSQATSTAEWKDLREFILDRDHRRCQIQYKDRCIGRATVVDKKVPASRRPDLAYDPENLRAACEPCNDHKARTEDRRPKNRR